MRLLILLNKFLICFLKSGDRFCLSRKSVILFVRRCLICLNLFSCERKLIAKHGSDWRLRVFDNEFVEFLKLVEHAHSVIDRSAKATQTGGREENRTLILVVD